MDDGSGGLDVSFADINVTSNNLTADNPTSPLLYWSGQVKTSALHQWAAQHMPR